MNNVHSLILIAIMSLVTIVIRFLPFWVFGNRKTPEVITYLGNVLPYAIMGMLVIFCLKNVSLVAYPFGLAEMIASITVIFMHVWKRNTLLSIVSGTFIYMVLVQVVF